MPPEGLLCVGGFVLLVLIVVIANYNRLAKVRQHMHESWSDIDVEMKRRYDLVPNLVATVKAFATHESGLFEEVARLRTQAVGNHGSAAEQAVDETALAIGLGKVFALAEGYPTLKSDTQFLALQTELANTEDRIAAARRFYNGNVRELNQLCDGFPSGVLANMFGFTRASYFELASNAERVVPRVNL